jgi:hypothetical protein
MRHSKTERGRGSCKVPYAILYAAFEAPAKNPLALCKHFPYNFQFSAGGTLRETATRLAISLYLGGKLLGHSW